jgi:peroxiredoxin Q/BCP
MIMKRLLLAFTTLLSVSTAATAEPLVVGTPAPHVTALDQDGSKVSFADVYQKGLTLVYFYPKADTGGCTAEACSIRDSFEKLKAEGLQVIGVSRDTTDSQKKFTEKYHLPFVLIADTDGDVAKAFGVPMMGFGLLPYASRESFIVKHGKVAWTSLSAKTTGSAQEVQTALDGLK